MHQICHSTNINYLKSTFLKSNSKIYSLEQDRYSNTDFFQNARVKTCSKIQKIKGTSDQFIAIPFYQKRPNSVYPTRSEHTSSWSKVVYELKEMQHSGMGKDKSLQKYNPLVNRNRNLVNSFVAPYRNTSKFEIGERDRRSRKHYLSMYRNDFNGMQTIPCGNAGISAYRNQWLKKQLIR